MNEMEKQQRMRELRYALMITSKNVVEELEKGSDLHTLKDALLTQQMVIEEMKKLEAW